MLRNRFVHEQGRTLHLLSAISPEWIGFGKRLAVSGATTHFGRVSFEFKTLSDKTAILYIGNSFSDAPREIVLHLPWFLEVVGVTADGKPASIDRFGVHLPHSVREVRIHYHRLSQPKMSYERTVLSFKQEYRSRWQQFRRTGEMPVGSEIWQVPE